LNRLRWGHGGRERKAGKAADRERSEQDQDWRSAQPRRRKVARAMDAKWRGKGLTLPLPVIYRSRGATPPGTTRVAPIKCRQRHQPLTSRPHRAEMVVHTRVCDHCGAVTEGPRCPVTSAPTWPTTSAQRRLKRRARYAQPLPRQQSINGWVPYQVRITPHSNRAKSSKKRPS
jgi:hypothetical protein